MGKFLWTTVMLCFAVIAGTGILQDVVHTGTDIKFEAYPSLAVRIDAEADVQFEAASSRFFVMHNRDGMAIVGLEQEPPLGFSDPNYFISAPITVKSGTWEVDQGSPKVHLTSAKEMTITQFYTDQVGVWIIVIVFALIVWLFGLYIGRYIH